MTAAMKELDLTYRTMFAELLQRCLDASFHAEFPLDARFVEVPVKGRVYWYLDRPEGGKVKRTYVGPKDDVDISRRVAEFRALKGDLKSRRKLVSTLTREAGLPVPDRFAGDVVEVLARAGLFRLRGVLVGTVAFQAYAGHLGVRLPSAALQTGDADFAQFHSISTAVDDSLPPVLQILRSVDPTFREIPHQTGARRTTAFTNATNFRVEFLTPNRGSADHDGEASEMPALGGASAQPLRFLDFLIYEPVRSLLLHKSGVPVLVPSPERYAVHKLIVAARRRGDLDGATKRSKDVLQADRLVEALAQTRRQGDLALAFSEAWRRGPAWREAIGKGLGYLQKGRSEAVWEVLAEGLREIGEDPGDFRTAERRGAVGPGR